MDTLIIGAAFAAAALGYAGATWLAGRLIEAWRHRARAIRRPRRHSAHRGHHWTWPYVAPVVLFVAAPILAIRARRVWAGVR
jgi:hypothetical protein